MPVSILHGASLRTEPRVDSAGTIRPLLPRWRILLLQDVLNDQVRLLNLAAVSKEHRPRAIAYKNEGVVGNAHLIHEDLLLRRPAACSPSAQGVPLRATRATEATKTMSGSVTPFVRRAAESPWLDRSA